MLISVQIKVYKYLGINASLYGFIFDLQRKNKTILLKSGFTSRTILLFITQKPPFKLKKTTHMSLLNQYIYRST